jgi:hypothetical protein
MNKGILVGSFRTTMNNISALDDLLFAEMVEKVKAEKARRKPVKAFCTPKKRGRKPIYNSEQERKQAVSNRNKQRIIDRNAQLLAEGKPIPKRGRPRKPLDLCDVMCN